MLQKGKFLTYFIWSFFSLASTVCFAQLSIPMSDDLRMLAEGNEHYEHDVFGYAQDRYDNFLNIPIADRSPSWSSHESQARLRSAICGLWLEQEEAQHELVKLIHSYKPDPIAYEAAMEVGHAYYNKKRYRQAIQYYDLIDLDQLSKDKKSEVAFKRGYCHFVKKQFDLAENYLSQASAFRTVHYYPSSYYLGMISFFNEDYDMAATHFEKVTASKKYKAFVSYYLTQIYFNEGKYQQVVDYASQQISMPDIEKEVEIKNLIGRSYFELGDEANALKYLREVEQTDTKLTATDHYQVGYLSYKEGSYDEAITHLKEIAALKNSTGVQANYYLGHAYIKNNQQQAARSAFANVRRNSKNVQLQDEATYNYGLMSAGLNHDREAVNALMEIKPTSNYYQVAQEALAQLFSKTEDYDNALKILEDIDKSNPLLKEAYQKVTFYKGKQLQGKGKQNAALALYNKSLTYPIDADIHAQTLFAKGLAQHKQSKYDESVRSLNAFNTLHQNKNDESTYMAPYVLGYNYLKQKKYNEANVHLSKAIDLIDQNNRTISSDYIKTNMLCDALVRKGDCNFHSNNYDQAQENYQRAYGLKKTGFIYAYYQSALIYGLQGDPIQKIVILEDLQERHPKSELADDALLEASRTYLKLGKYDEASVPLLTLTKKYKKSDLTTQAYLTLGLISYNKGAIPQATQFYKQVFDYNPSQEERQDAYRALQEIYVSDLKDPDEYLAFVEEVSGGKIENTVRDSLNYKSAYSSYVNGEYTEVTKNLTTYITKFPNGLYSIEAHYFRGECAALEKDYSNAYRDYKYVVEQGGSQYYEKSLRKVALIAYNDLQNYEQAYTYANELSSLNVSSDIQVEALLIAMRSAHRLGRDQETLRLAQLVQEHPAATDKNKYDTDYYLALLLYADKKYDEALPPLNRLSKQRKDEFAAEARYLIADIYYMKKEFDIAEEMCRLAIKENANYPYWVANSIILLSDVLIERGDQFNAKAALEAVIENFTEDQSLVQKAQQKLDAIKANEARENNLIPANDDLLELEEN